MREGWSGRNSAQQSGGRVARRRRAGSSEAPSASSSRGTGNVGGRRERLKEAAAQRGAPKQVVEHGRLALGPRAQDRRLDLHLPGPPPRESTVGTSAGTFFLAERESSEHEIFHCSKWLIGRACSVMRHSPARGSMPCCRFSGHECASALPEAARSRSVLLCQARTRGACVEI